ncbi:metal-sensitive transcriptional regulator [Roseofilum casamattae]|uniref:Metal-sensitive transcriptional regulator n=1 Tax=Roseofilum casamattae BLCC-M143 TaxID=3022442 RepID=A0ABT7BXN1_9CYAN|nr:metal-sensitive transcriptional regulator [Roseofilum casamattae]MDJ1183916.1 metal-sensitive transcriptional regulator [Roseofilum casamattae BLCC-M143]
MTHTESAPNSPSTEHHHHPHEPNSLHPHVHSQESLRQIINQLSRIEGHVRGIKNMVQQSTPCPDVLIQLAAVRGAIDRVSRIILDEHLTECIGRAATEGNIEEELEHLKAALDRFLPLAKKKSKTKKASQSQS